MSGYLTNEMSAFKAGRDNMFGLILKDRLSYPLRKGLIKEVGHANILSTTRTGAGDEDARGGLKGNIRTNPLVSGSRDTRAVRQADAQMEKTLRNARL